MLFIALVYGKNGVVQLAQPFAAMGADVVKSSAVLLSIPHMLDALLIPQVRNSEILLPLGLMHEKIPYSFTCVLKILNLGQIMTTWDKKHHI